MEVSGYIIDEQTKEPLPGAYAELWSGSIMLKRSAANDRGYFSVSSPGSGNGLVLSHTGYESQTMPISGSSFNMHYPMKREYKEEQEVIVESHPTKDAMGLVILVGLFLLYTIHNRRG